MNAILSEKDYQRYIIDRLVESGYEERPATEFDRLHALNPNALMAFLEATQQDTLTSLRKVYKDKTQETILSAISTAETSKSGSRLEILKHGLSIGHHHIDLMYDKPASGLNKELVKRYQKNIFTVTEEVWASDKERVDLILFLNGIAVMAFELKCNTAGQNYGNAIKQWRTERSPKTRLFLWKAGVLVCFAMDLEQVHMTTRLSGTDTFFLPFNQGSGKGINAGAGNPLCDDDYSVHYMWDDILQKDTVLEIIRRFMFIEVKKKEDPKTGKEKVTETVIFPRYHQLDVVRKILSDVLENGTSRNYLLQHSAGSGKTNEIAWLSYRLASLHDALDRNVFDNIIICTDRVVVDRQLQDAVMGLEHKAGQVKVLDDTCSSADLKYALEGNTKIVATTIQKFPYIVGNVGTLKNKKFAVIIDEAHSSTAGKNMAAVTKTLASEVMTADYTVEDEIEDQILKSGKQENVSMFAFTATPKPTTLQIFGTVNPQGEREAFHIYSMKQAIEEGFILDVLQNYVTYDTFFKLNKEIEDDPTMKTSDAKRQIARFIQLHETNIGQRIEIIVEHFRNTVMKELGGQAKAMVVTESRAGAVKYYKAFDDYIKRKGYTDIHALVAFSGKVTVDGDEYTEPGLNGFSEKKLTSEFDTDDYQVLIVADKYQTGFDQKKLCAMYILKRLHGVSVVQTLSRLNRICPPYDKKTFVLDFANTYEEIEKAFSTYFTTTILSNTVTPASVYDIYRRLMGYYVIDEDDVTKFVELLYNKDYKGNKTTKMINLLQKTATVIGNRNLHTEEEAKAIKQTIRHFIRCYEFLLQVTSLEDSELHKTYLFLTKLQAYLNNDQPGIGFDLKGKLQADDFMQKKTETHTTGAKISNPELKLSNADRLNLTEEKVKRLSEIIAEINSRTGKSYDEDVAATALLQIRDLMKKNPDLARSARNNKIEDFKMVYDDKIDDALIEGLDQNQDFYTMLLNQPDLKHELLDMFLSDVYQSYQTGVTK
ncbi:MAG: DEAD/DEAH box helicase family protein [Spirochaetales bacterium]|nr:DEAD/DEAH box helicase family protein [Spirochaetales bacterium]